VNPDHAPIALPLPPPIARAYVGALEVECTNCGAAAGVYCTKSTGQLRRTPCVMRCGAITPDPGSPDPDGNHDAADARPAPPAVPNPPPGGYFDPSEPRHPRDDQ
jgi:hypothetical protein